MRDPEIRPIPPTEPFEDFQLIRRFLEAGYPRCFRSLVERHKPSVRRLLWVMLDGARDEIEDVEQEVLLALYRGLPRFA
jgi:DNA-directed RNA polymerase specialized sigma24 family protein